MLKSTHTPATHFESIYTLEVDDIDELIKYITHRIRQKSQKHYISEIKNVLCEKKEMIIDQHAGQGTFYILKYAN